MKAIFYGKDSKLRSGWRALLFLFAYLFISGIGIYTFIAARGELETERQAPGLVPLIVPFSIATVTAIVLGWLAGRVFENVGFEALGISLRQRWLRDLGLGAAIGTITIVLAVLSAIVTGSMSLTINRGSAVASIAWNLATTFLVFFVGAASEETLFRGYPLQTFVRSNIAWVGVAFTALLFALAHNQNPNVSGIAWFNTFLAGIWFAVAYLKTRDLWFPFGIHLAWNWLQGPIFGINVSGIGDFSPDPLMRATDNGPAWLTGGAYGIEGGIACTFALMLSSAVIWYLPVEAEPPA